MSLLNEIMLEAEQGSEAWYKIRLGKFTSSRVKEIICKRGDITIGAMSYIAEKASEILTGEEQETFESEDMIWGKTYEPVAAKVYEEKTGLKVTECGFVIHNEFYGGSPDRLVEPGGILEIKCPGKSKNHIKNCMANSQETLKKLRPDAYYQIQSNLFLTERQWGHFVSYDPRVTSAEFFMIHVKRDEDDIKEILAAIEMASSELKSVLKRLKGE
jgi:hypothetical protein